ncbi:MAG: flagellar export chaperone FliS [Burkholderiales bacterium]
MVQSTLAAYTKVEVETGLTEADPHKLVVMLFEGAIRAVAQARGHMLRGETAAKGEAISKAVAIIDEGLKLSLDLEVGGELAKNLSALYDYMSTRLIYGNLKNYIEPLDEVGRLLAELKTAWEAIGKRGYAAADATPAVAVSSQSAARGSA